MAISLYGAGSDSEEEPPAARRALDVSGDEQGTVTSDATPVPTTTGGSSDQPKSTAASLHAGCHVVVAGEDSESDQDVWFRRRAAQPAPARKLQAARRPSPGKPADDLGKAIAGVAQAVVAAMTAAQNQSPGGSQPSLVEATRPPTALKSTPPPTALTATPGTPPPTALTGQSTSSGVQEAGVSTAQTQEGGRASAPHGEDDGEAKQKKKERAPRGSAGTFAGRRPPKDAAKLALFNAKREAHMKAKEEAKNANKKTPSLRQRAYWEKLSAKMAGNGVVPPVAMKRPAAAAIGTPSPKKKTAGNEETPEKVPHAGEQPAQPGAGKVA